MKKTLALFIAVCFVVSCGNPSTDSSLETSKDNSTDLIDDSSPEPLSSELFKEEGMLYTTNNLSDEGDGVELHLKGGAYFIAKDKKQLELEGVADFETLEGGEKIEVEYMLSGKEYTTKMAYVDGAKGKIAGFLGSVEGSEQSEEIDLVSYEFVVEGNDATCIIKGKNKKGELVEYQSSWAEMNKNGVYGNDFQLNTKSMEAIEGSGLYEKIEKWEGEESSDSGKGITKLILLEGESKMAKILISTITYRLKEMKKIRIIQ